MSKKNWIRKECNVCKSYNLECRMGASGIYPYKKKEVVKEKEVHDTD